MSLGGAPRAPAWELGWQKPWVGSLNPAASAGLHATACPPHHLTGHWASGGWLPSSPQGKWLGRAPSTLSPWQPLQALGPTQGTSGSQLPKGGALKRGGLSKSHWNPAHTTPTPSPPSKSRENSCLMSQLEGGKKGMDNTKRAINGRQPLNPAGRTSRTS